MSMIKVESVGQNTLDRVNKILGSIGNGGAAVRAVYQAAKRAGQRGRTEASRFAGAEYTIGSGGFLAGNPDQAHIRGRGNRVTQHLGYIYARSLRQQYSIAGGYLNGCSLCLGYHFLVQHVRRKLCQIFHRLQGKTVTLS